MQPKHPRGKTLKFERQHRGKVKQERNSGVNRGNRRRRTKKGSPPVREKSGEKTIKSYQRVFGFLSQTVTERGRKGHLPPDNGDVIQK